MVAAAAAASVVEAKLKDIVMTLVGKWRWWMHATFYWFVVSEMAVQ